MKNQNHINRFFKTLGFWEKISAEKLLIFRISDRKTYFYYLYRKKNKLEFIQHGLASSESPMAQEEFFLSLKKSLQRFKFKPDRVLVTVSGPGVLVRTVDIPEVPEKNLKTTLFYLNKSELDKFHSESIWDYQILEKYKQNGKPFFRILIIVMESEFLEKVYFAIKQLGYKVGFLLPELVLYDLALLRLGIGNKEKAIISVDDDLTSIFYFKGGKLLHSRIVPIGKPQLQKSLEREFSRNIKAVRRKLIDMGQPEAISEKVKEKVFLLSLQKSEVIQSLMGEIRKSLSAISNEYNFPPNEPFIALGSGFSISGITDLIEKEFKRPVLTPFPRFKPSDNFESSSVHAIAIGTALFNGDRFLFVPQSVSRKKRSRTLAFAAIVTFVLWGVGIGFLSNYKINQVRKVFLSYSKVRKKALALSPKANKFNKLNKEVETLINTDLHFYKLGGYDYYPVIGMKLISKALPEGITILRMKYEGMEPSAENYRKTITIQGSSYDNPHLWNKNYPAFVESLKKSGYFSHVIPIHYDYSQAEKKGVFLIELKKEIKSNE